MAAAIEGSHDARRLKMDMERYILAHDLGTSGNKATLFSATGALIGNRTVGYATQYGANNHVEQDAQDWWRAVTISTKELLESFRVDPRQVEAISFSGQMMGCLCVDRDGEPLRKSIIWADQRSERQVEQLEEAVSQEDFYRIVGHRNTPSYGIQKLMWIRDNEPEIYEQTYKVLNAKDFIIFKLTGRFVTDYSDANSMGCFDINHMRWSERILEGAGIEADKFPDAHPSTLVAGTVNPGVCAEVGLAETTKVVVGAGDGVTANIGAGAIRPGQAYCSIGTSAWVTATAEQPVFDPERRTVTWAHAIPGYYAPNATMQFAGGSLSWLKEILYPGSESAAAYREVNQLVSDSGPGSGGVIFLPYLLGERAPRWDVDTKGSVLGITPSTTRGDLLRAVMEGVTYNLAIGLDVLSKELPIKELSMIGGGARSEVWQSIAADIFGVPILVPALLEEAGSMGAAVIAGVGAGVFQDFDVIHDFIDIRNRVEPNSEHRDIYGTGRRRFDDFYLSLKSVYANA